MFDMIKFGRRIADIRQNAGLTQTQAARAAGVAPNLDYMIETWTDSEDWRAPQELQVSRKLVLSWAHADASGARRRRRAKLGRLARAAGVAHTT